MASLDHHRVGYPPRSVQDVALEHRLPPRKVLHVVRAELRRDGHGGPSQEEPFEADLTRLGVYARRRPGAWSTTSTTPLRSCVAVSSGVRLTIAEAETVASHLRTYLAVIRSAHPAGFECGTGPMRGRSTRR